MRKIETILPSRVPENAWDIWRKTTEILLAASLRIEPDLVFLLVRKDGKTYAQFSGEIFEIAGLPEQLTEFITQFQNTGGSNPCN